MHILDAYVHTPPSPQNALDIFKGTWSCRMPEPYAHLQAGLLPVFEDARIPWAAEKLGGFENKTVLELGPLEGAQTYLLERHGAAEIVAIEANTLAYLKCLVVKELLGLQRATFLCGDFVPYLRANQRRFDVCIASGVLYHMRNPAELIASLAHATDRLFLWTHYYDWAIIAKRADLVARHTEHGEPAEHRGFEHMLYRQVYQADLKWCGFCGGSAPYSNWMSREDILACLDYFGFDQIEVSFEDLNHGGGPSFAIAATRTRPELRPRWSDDTLPGEDQDETLAKEAIPLNQSDDAPTNPVNERLREALQRQDAYIARLEQHLAEKNQHIARLEDLLRQVESGRLMRMIRRFKRT